MIKTKKDYLEYLEADRNATYRKRKRPLPFYEHEWRYLIVMRKLEYLINCKSGYLNKLHIVLFKYKLYRLGLTTGFTIPPNTLGKGVKIFHYGTIIINHSARIGEGCQLHCSTNIASGVVIGKDVLIAPGVKISNNVKIADNIRIGANSVVTRDLLESNITVAGAPAVKISSKPNLVVVL